MADCKEDFMSMEVGAKKHFDSFLSKGKGVISEYPVMAKGQRSSRTKSNLHDLWIGNEAV